MPDWPRQRGHGGPSFSGGWFTEGWQNGYCTGLENRDDGQTPSCGFESYALRHGRLPER